MATTPSAAPDSLRMPAEAVSYRLDRWAAEGSPPLLQSTLAGPAPQEAGFEPGMYRLTVNMKLPDGRVVSRTIGVLRADWDLTVEGDEQPQRSDGLLDSAEGKGIERRRLPAVAAIYEFKDPPQAFWAFLRTTGKTSVNLPSGRYRFTVSSVDGVRLLVDGRVAVNAWSGHRPRRDFRDLELDEGLHELKFEAFQKGRRGLLWIRVEPSPTWNAPALRHVRSRRQGTE